MQGIGVLIMGIRSRAYGEMAVNLANSLKAFCPDIPLCGISDGAIESVDGYNIFDSIVSVPKNSNPFELKTRLNELSPFSKTLWIDADSIFIGNPSALFDSLKGIEFACMEYKRHAFNSIDGPIWATCEEIFNHYQLSRYSTYPEYNSSVMFWTKSVLNDQFFHAANFIYKSAPCKLLQDVGGFFPDEIAFGCASSLIGYYSEFERWQPAYLQWEVKSLPESEILKNYCLLTRSGAREDQYIDRIYNSAAAKAAKKLNMKYFKMNIKNKVHAN